MGHGNMDEYVLQSGLLFWNVMHLGKIDGRALVKSVKELALLLNKTKQQKTIATYFFNADAFF